MPLTPGQNLTHYEILGPLGAGAMGEVWRARDTRLEREVAIKVLPEHLADDEERLRRFEREARTLASLSHANLAHVYGIDQVGDTCFLAMELVSGEDLEQRLRRGALPVGEALDVCRQIAEGLEAAHEAGVVHRDLKPANVRVTPEGVVKVLDFGLAKPLRPRTSSGSGAPSAEPDSFLMTEEGLVLGTPTYMSPEQARGKPVDRRTDVWALGCVLFECLTGERAFGGETLSDVLGAVLHDEPDLARLRADTPPRARELIERCLRKDPASRLQDVGDARVALAELCGRLAPPRSSVAPTEPAAAFRPGRAALLVAAGVVSGALVALALRRDGGPAQEPAVPLNVVMALPGFSGLRDQFAAHPMISRDGRWLAYPGREGLHVRSLERIEDRDVPGSDGADGMFWAPGSDALGFSKDGRLWTWSLERAESRPIAPLPGKSEFNGAAWMPDGRIYFSMYGEDLYAVSAAGGTPERVLAREPGEVDFHLPSALPGRDEFVAVAHREQGEQEVFVFLCGERRRVPVLEMEGLSSAVWSPAGYLLMVRNWTTQDLWAVRYSPDSRQVDGQPFQVEVGLQSPSVADDGAFVCIEGNRGALYDMLWVSRDKSLTLIPGGPFPGLSRPALSPDGKRIAYSAVSDDNRDIWVLDVERGTRLRLTLDPTNEDAPRWSTDGRTIFFARSFPGDVSVYRVAADGSSPPALVADHVSEAAPLPDGSAVLVRIHSEVLGDANIARCALDGGAQPVLLLDSPFDEDQPAVSPDGRWLAYRSNETGRDEVFLRALSGPPRKLQASLDGGALPMWGPRGETLCFLRGGDWMEVRLTPGDDPELERPVRLFSAADLGLAVGHDVQELVGLGLSPDGSRFLVGRRSPVDPRAGVVYFRRFQP